MLGSGKSKVPKIRRECYHRIRDYMQSAVLQFYTQNPKLLGDERSRIAMEQSMTGLEGIFGILDDYEIRKRKTNEGPQDTDE